MKKFDTYEKARKYLRACRGTRTTGYGKKIPLTISGSPGNWKIIDKK